jgi:non-ribosomal peptide synthetase component F
MFTSGTAGRAKGIVLSHTNFCTATKYQAQLLGFEPHSRIFEFASHAYDGAVHSMFTTLAVGGCLCVPSEAERWHNFNQAMARYKATLVDLTPAVARLIDLHEVPDLETVMLGGEAVATNDAVHLWKRVTIKNAYGPAECASNSVINADPLILEDVTKIGKGAGVVTWVVNQWDHDQLVAPGCIGELVLEGSLVGNGYLGENGLTKAAFIDTPRWLRLRANFQDRSLGRRGRFYETGDLVRQNPDGSLNYIGRQQRRK